MRCILSTLFIGVNDGLPRDMRFIRANTSELLCKTLISKKDIYYGNSSSNSAHLQSL